METDIRKPDTGKVTISRPTPLTSHTNTETTTTPEMHSPVVLGDHYAEPVSEGEEDEAMAIALPMSENTAARVPLAEALEAIAWREQQRREQEVEIEKRRTEGRLEGVPEDEPEIRAGIPFRRRDSPKTQESSKGSKTLSIDPLAPSVEFDRRFKKKLGRRGRGSRSISRDPSAERREEEEEAGAAFAEASGRNQAGDTIYTNAFSAQAGKRIAVPVRVEPKVFFAQERTFLVRFNWAAMSTPMSMTDVDLIRNGFTSESCSELSPLLSSTSPSQAIPLALFAQELSLRFPFSLSLMLRVCSSTAHLNSGSSTQMLSTMTHTGQPF